MVMYASTWRLGVRNYVLFPVVVGLTVAGFAGAACGTSNPDGGGINLPQRIEAGDDAAKAGDSAAPSCESLTLKVGEPASCDKCAKDKCCAEVLACTNSAACTALQECLEPCDQQDFLCIVTCQETNPEGNDTLGKVGSCARSKCKNECPTDIPDADIFGDGGL
jgi:hypothetical protein